MFWKIANQSVDQFIKWRRSAGRDVCVYDLLHLYKSYTGWLMNIHVKEFVEVMPDIDTTWCSYDAGHGIFIGY